MLNIIENFFWNRSCELCGFKLKKTEEIICMDCFKEIKKSRALRKVEDRTWVLFDYTGKVRSLILGGKYRFNLKIWNLWSRFFSNLSWGSDNIIVYVPMTFRRFCYRGFNQSYLIAIALEKLGYGRVVKILKRKNFEKSSSLQNKKERMASLAGVFEIKEFSCELMNNNVIIVDDVLTTGTTLNEVERTLVEAGFETSRIRKFALASGRLKDH